MTMYSRTLLFAAAAAIAGSLPALFAADDAGAMPSAEESEARYLRHVRQITFIGSKNGEAYFSPDASQIVFQGVREAGNPFYQIYRMNLANGEAARVSSGTGRTTCAYFHPKKARILFASSHLDPASVEKQKAEIEKLKAGPSKRYAWDFDPFFDLFETDPDGGNPLRLTSAEGYDAEGSYSPDGSRIVFCSMRDGDHEIYVMDADGKNPQRLTHEKGYDGGPFFSPDGKQIVWRHFDDESQKSAEIWLMNADGSNKRKLTNLKSVSWAPFFHPSMEWMVFAGNHEDPGFDVYAMRLDGSELTRLTYTRGFDGLPVISPDGATLMWTSNRSENKSQIFMADLSLPLKDKPIRPTFSVASEAALNADQMMDSPWNMSRAANAGNLDHYVARQLQEIRLQPMAGDLAESTFYIMGPSVTGWVPPVGESTSAVVVGAVLKQEIGCYQALVAALEAARLARVDQQADKKKTSHPAILLMAANEDELLRAEPSASGSLLSAAKDKKNPVQPSVFVSLAGKGNVRSGQLVLRGAGTSSGWRVLAEQLAVRHPKVQIVVEDDPAAAPELATFIEKKIPCISLAGVGEPQVATLDVDEAAAEGEHRLNVVQAAVDCVRLVARGAVELPYSAYDAAAAKAAASASARPYLGTIPEYKSEGVAGVKLSGVREGSPAERVGIKAGDVIVELSGAALKDVNDYLKVLERLKPGEETGIRVQRGAEVIDMKIVPGTR